ncbi:uncharacterized protein C2845_PM02G39110 [Panicum miliaceum]|uniref:DET1- and DDB1-associated protein 1 domain-containing protein n=1 Tax=Panicum miliaceum TaxID=4540 RepID=A0A3L6SD51_PANMI|nr:uncharacterized protein C2845_PM02G39110 [Panicum miliaceum]
MGSPVGGWPSYNPHNFSQLVPADPSAQPSVAETKESSSRQSRSGEQQQTAQGSGCRCWKPVKRKKLNHSWWLSSSASLNVIRPVFGMPAEACVLLIADG